MFTWTLQLKRKKNENKTETKNDKPNKETNYVMDKEKIKRSARI